jgi:sugar/nucleoside kinase (ribokinase family)
MVTRETGVRTSFNHAGANALLAVDDVDFRRDSSRIFYLGTLFFLEALDAPDPRHGTRAAALLATARKHGLKTCVDIERTNLPPALFEAGGRAALKQTDLVILNVEVAEALSGVRIRYPAGVEIAAAESAARALQSLGSAERVIIRFPTGAIGLGEDGSIAAEGSVKLPKSRVVSAAGAGHAFAAGVLYGCHEEWELSECLRAGHAAAAACLRDKTASGGITTLDACLKLLDKYGQRELGEVVARPSLSAAV